MKFRVTKYSDLKGEEISQWKRYVQFADPFNSPLLQPEYAQALSEVRNDVEIGVVQQNGTPVGFLPFHRIKRSYGLPIGAEVSDIHAILAADDTMIEEAEWLKGFGLNRFDFDHMVGPISQQYVHRYDQCYRIKLDLGFEAYKAELRSRGKFQTQIERKFRKLQRDFQNVDFVWQIHSSEAMNKLIHWKGTDLESRGYSSPFKKRWVVDLLSRLRKHEQEDVSGLLSGLIVDGEFAALHFGVVNSSCLVSWLPCINPAFASYSPGGLLIYQLAKSAADKGISVIDLGRGENQTKVRLANDTIEMAIGSICTSAVSCAMTRAIAKTKQRVKAAKKRI